MAVKLFCMVCKDITLHGGERERCLVCKSREYKAAKAVTSNPCKLLKLEEDIYDIRKSLR